MGMGCGDVCDTQYLFCNDILGTNTGHYLDTQKNILI